MYGIFFKFDRRHGSILEATWDMAGADPNFIKRGKNVVHVRMKTPRFRRFST